jgi:hypothetical protein
MLRFKPVLQEVEHMRQQAQIWSDVSSSEVQKMRAEGELLTAQLAARSAELAGLRQQLTDVEAERDRALQERQQVGRLVLCVSTVRLSASMLLQAAGTSV